MSEQSPNRRDQLSSWKEIADYLDCARRTCIRWENEKGLPIHRFEGSEKSRVYAYKHELDAWLKAKLNNNNSSHKIKKSQRLGLFSLLFLIPIIALALFLFMKKKDPPPSVNSATASVPRSNGPLDLQDNDIVTTEFGPQGRLGVWRKNSKDEYECSWKIEPVSHATLAVGNLDHENGNEIVAPGICREKIETGDRLDMRWRFFLNIYKPGYKDWWKTTYYRKDDCVYEDSNFEMTEIAIGDVDGVPGNEVILITKQQLAIFKYFSKDDEFHLIRTRLANIDDEEFIYKSLSVHDLDHDGICEILVAADELKNEETVLNQGKVLIFKFHDNWLSIAQSITIDANLGFQSLAVGDIIPGGDSEILVPGYRINNDSWNSYIIGWDFEGNKLIDKPVYDQGSDKLRILHMALGNLDKTEGDEIVIGLHVPDEILVFNWNGNKLIKKCRHPLEEYISIANISIDKYNANSDFPGKVILCGSVRTVKDRGRFYLEVLGFDNGFFSTWLREGGEKNELRVSYAGVN